MPTDERGVPKLKLYKIKVSFVTVVAARDPDEARMVYSRNIKEILDTDCNGVNPPGILVDGRITTEEDLPYPWTGHCLPWGVDKEDHEFEVSEYL